MYRHDRTRRSGRSELRSVANFVRRSVGRFLAVARSHVYGLGGQYRAVVFAHDPDQEAAARASNTALEHSGVCRARIVT